MDEVFRLEDEQPKLKRVSPEIVFALVGMVSIGLFFAFVYHHYKQAFELHERKAKIRIREQR